MKLSLRLMSYDGFQVSKYLTWASLFLTLFGVCPAALANVSCRSLFSHASGTHSTFEFHPKYQHETGYNIPRNFSDLHPIHRRWLQWVQPLVQARARSHQWHMEEVGNTLSINEAKFPIVALLGHGQEAAVYLVSTPEGLRSAKVFTKDSAVSIQKYGMSLNNSEARSPLIIEEGTEGRTILFEYLEGIPVSQIYSARQVLGITDGQAASILNRFNALSEKYFQETGKYLANYNAVYSFKFDAFAMVDPH